MSDDSDLTRLFAEQHAAPEDEAFVAQVTGRIARRRQMAPALPAAAAALLALAIWATWPSAYLFSADALSGATFIANGIGEFSTTPIGVLTALVLLVTAAVWAWVHEQMHGARF